MNNLSLSYIPHYWTCRYGSASIRLKYIHCYNRVYMHIPLIDAVSYIYFIGFFFLYFQICDLMGQNQSHVKIFYMELNIPVCKATTSALNW